MVRDLSSLRTPKACPCKLELTDSKDHYSLRRRKKHHQNPKTNNKTQMHGPGYVETLNLWGPLSLSAKQGWKHCMGISKINRNWCLLRPNNLPGFALSILTLGFNNYFEILVLLLFPFLWWENWGSHGLTSLLGMILTSYQNRNGNC